MRMEMKLMAKNQKVEVLLLDSHFNGTVEEKEIKNGMIEYKEKTFLVDSFMPIRVLKKSLFSSKIVNMYILKHDTVIPSDNMNPTGENLKMLFPQFASTMKMTPEMLKKLINMKILGNMIKTKKDSSNLLWIMVALVAGFAVMYLLVSTGIITPSQIQM